MFGVDGLEPATGYDYEVLVDGEPRKEIRITPENLFTFDNVLHLRGDALDAGEYEFFCSVHPTTMTGTLTVQ